MAEETEKTPEVKMAEASAALEKTLVAETAPAEKTAVTEAATTEAAPEGESTDATDAEAPAEGGKTFKWQTPQGEVDVTQEQYEEFASTLKFGQALRLALDGDEKAQEYIRKNMPSATKTDVEAKAEKPKSELEALRAEVTEMRQRQDDARMQAEAQKIADAVQQSSKKHVDMGIQGTQMDWALQYAAIAAADRFGGGAKGAARAYETFLGDLKKKTAGKSAAYIQNKVQAAKTKTEGPGGSGYVPKGEKPKTIEEAASVFQKMLETSEE